MAVLFGTTGQISGPYAAIVVGASAPVLLTQLARIQSVSETLGGGPAGAGPADLLAAAGDGPADPAQQPVQSVVQPVLPEPGAAVLDGPHAATAAALQPGAEAGPSQRASQQLRSAILPQDTDAAQPNGRPAELGHGHRGRETPPLRGEQAVGEEGRP